MDSAVLDLPAPVAVRLRRPGWRDPRLLVGVTMVAASVALGSWVVRSAQTTVSVYVAREALVPGQRIAADDVVVADVQLADGELEHYLRADEPLPDDAVAVRVVGQDELVPANALGSAADLDVRSVAIPLERAPSRDVTVGALVDVWFSPAPSGTDVEAEDPRQLASSLPVAEVSRPERSLGGSGGSAVHVLVPQGQLPDVLAALASDGVLDVVPVPGTGG
ncbi:hypothetical protein [Cellulomonas rhizosphaerae]|uniref:SAF domain-containing protein n=1 Tax=Cellulomonas rhizosphaerae TaxID=2293719 RepID=A0A413RK78_9CELL|nr:hypothetical protein [Cellulomonas rhizosphaerae]RHA39385.1 hypothetical protein D1825_12015 [Cellulomonas rhizosphaerae]